VNVGIDFDNTIVSYDKVFYAVALEQSLIPQEIKESKMAVRDYLRSIDENDIWTELQGHVYGKRMLEAEIYPGFLKFLEFTKKNEINLSIVSHKTVYPYRGKKYNLHDSAREFIAKRLSRDGKNFIPENKVFFETTQQDKAKRIGLEKCNFFIDDLPEILCLENFPNKTIKCLFDPEGNNNDYKGDCKFSDWEQIISHLKHEISRR